MAIKQVKSTRRRYLVWIGALAVTGYFAYHAFYGGHGLLSMQTLQAEHEGLRAELAKLQKEKAYLEHRVSLLRPESLDPDMLDERARALLNQARPDEIVLTINRRGE